ncbi:MAG TPA: PAAR domain-containing protein, partial [Bacteroidales bacterium]|nr:PAAR domain-containing protein [Bacteroidales bacterium]
MGKPAARITDMHVCPMVTGMVPHVGGPVTGPGVPTVLIGNMPAAVMGDMCVCTGPPDTIILGSMGVFIGGKPAARMGDMCAHGGTIVAGCPNVLIGEALPGSPPSPVLPLPVKAAMQQMTPATAAVADQILTMKAAAKNGTPFCEKCAKAAAGKNKGDQNQQVLSALKPKDSNQPDYPTNSNPGIPDKRTRYNERLGLINNAKNTEPISPDAARAIQRLELNNEAVERAKLADHVYTLNNNTVPEGWIMVPHDKLPQDITWADEKSGFQAEIYQSTFTTPPKVVVSFRGTANKEGWFANLKQALGFKSKQHQQAIELAQRLKDQGINAEFTGHSLGGGLTSAAALVT